MQKEEDQCNFKSKIVIFDLIDIYQIITVR
jgi:hypothetical protein